MNKSEVFKQLWKLPYQWVLTFLKILFLIITFVFGSTSVNASSIELIDSSRIVVSGTDCEIATYRFQTMKLKMKPPSNK